MQTSDGIADFTSLLASTADAIISFDHLALRNMQAILDQQNSTPSLVKTLVSLLAPLSAFEWRFKTEEELREIFLRTMDQMTSRLPALIKEASHLCHLLDLIFKVLGRVRSVTLGEFKDTPKMNILVRLWNRLSRPNDYADGKSRLILLNDVPMYYQTAANIMKNNLFLLNKMRSDLRQLQHIRAVPVFVWQDIPLENTMYMINRAMKRLEYGRQKIDGMEPDEFSFPMSTATSTVLA
ncbi:hypothetical protein EPUS_00956 [Endocarpon pusillum Z07020]|uniref:Uncharacterized protein n=1 Tax=Endocarpon pusillum (strain Z07020 / HMAS-L-300199) TaxID=1263415 RepID=U1G8E0_ENDPU|nr:uncharacterized protein EPUS_00956 [Endocarpon pusillum Z07020]ERF73702.1 hypothetical protein EPUS_00956 [Endocarpon pusillum Z07020]